MHIMDIIITGYTCILRKFCHFFLAQQMSFLISSQIKRAQKEKIKTPSIFSVILLRKDVRLAYNCWESNDVQIFL